MIFGGLSGSGKSFTADQLLMKMFQMSHKTDWIQDLRRVRTMFETNCSEVTLFMMGEIFMDGYGLKAVVAN